MLAWWRQEGALGDEQREVGMSFLEVQRKKASLGFAEGKGKVVVLP